VIPMELWMSDEMAKRRTNAVAKALREKPSVAPTTNGECLNVNYYRVKQYDVGTMMDADGRMYIECSCAAGSPPIDPETRLPSREAAPCYHAAAVLIHIAEQEKANE
jgi:hypothetical protein